MPMRADPINIWTRLSPDLDRIKHLCKTDDERKLFETARQCLTELYEAITTPERRGFTGGLNKQTTYQRAKSDYETFVRVSQMATDETVKNARWEDFSTSYAKLTAKQQEVLCAELGLQTS